MCGTEQGHLRPAVAVRVAVRDGRGRRVGGLGDEPGERGGSVLGWFQQQVETSGVAEGRDGGVPQPDDHPAARQQVRHVGGHVGGAAWGLGGGARLSTALFVHSVNM